jgi:hypothetical protein
MRIGYGLARSTLVALACEAAEVGDSRGVGRALTAYDLPIEGRDEWLAAARRLA